MADKKLPIAILAAAGFAELTFTSTQKTLLTKGRAMQVISPDGGLVQGWHADAWGHHFMADGAIGDALAAEAAGCCANIVAGAGARGRIHVSQASSRKDAAVYARSRRPPAGRPHRASRAARGDRRRTELDGACRP